MAPANRVKTPTTASRPEEAEDERLRLLRLHQREGDRQRRPARRQGRSAGRRRSIRSERSTIGSAGNRPLPRSLIANPVLVLSDPPPAPQESRPPPMPARCSGKHPEFNDAARPERCALFFMVGK